MKSQFKTIALIGRYRAPHVTETVTRLYRWLVKEGYKVVFEEDTAGELSLKNLEVFPLDKIAKVADLLIVLGGDGSLLRVVKGASTHKTPVLGINHGRLGFLTDIHPEKCEEEVKKVLQGHYVEETRFLLNVSLYEDDKLIAEDVALNEMVLMPGPVPHMIEFSIAIDEQLVCHQRADGIIVATPTGSTAYALSGGGPILYPELQAIVLVPMFPHKLSSRPIVVDSHSKIDIAISVNNESGVRVTCDGHARMNLAPKGHIMIQKRKSLLHLIHPENYSYFETLRTKLGWESKPYS